MLLCLLHSHVTSCCWLLYASLAADSAAQSTSPGGERKLQLSLQLLLACSCMLAGQTCQKQQTALQAVAMAVSRELPAHLPNGGLFWMPSLPLWKLQGIVRSCLWISVMMLGMSVATAAGAVMTGIVLQGDCKVSCPPGHFLLHSRCEDTTLNFQLCRPASCPRAARGLPGRPCGPAPARCSCAGTWSGAALIAASHPSMA